MTRPRSSSAQNPAQNSLASRASVSKEVDWSPQMKKNIYVNSALNIILSLHLSAPAAEKAKLKTVVSRSGFFKVWELQGAIFVLSIFPLLETVISKS